MRTRYAEKTYVGLYRSNRQSGKQSLQFGGQHRVFLSVAVNTDPKKTKLYPKNATSKQHVLKIATLKKIL